MVVVVGMARGCCRWVRTGHRSDEALKHSRSREPPLEGQEPQTCGRGGGQAKQTREQGAVKDGASTAEAKGGIEAADAVEKSISMSSDIFVTVPAGAYVPPWLEPESTTGEQSDDDEQQQQQQQQERAGKHGHESDVSGATVHGGDQRAARSQHAHGRSQPHDVREYFLAQREEAAAEVQLRAQVQNCRHSALHALAHPLTFCCSAADRQGRRLRVPLAMPAAEASTMRLWRSA